MPHQAGPRSQKNKEAGCSAFITKPMRLEDVLTVLDEQLGLEWVHDDSPRAVSLSPVADSAELDLAALPSGLARELMHLARMGDVRNLALRVQELPAHDSRLQGMSAALAGHISRYDLKGVRALLTRCTPDATVP